MTTFSLIYFVWLRSVRCLPPSKEAMPDQQRTMYNLCTEPNGQYEPKLHKVHIFLPTINEFVSLPESDAAVLLVRLYQRSHNLREVLHAPALEHY